MWKTILGSGKSGPVASSLEQEMQNDMQTWWQPLDALAEHPTIRHHPAVQAFLRQCAHTEADKDGREYFGIRESVEGAPWFEAALTEQTAATKKKNRYRDVLPFEKTRVRLRTPQSSNPAGDYINANYILNDQYIACCAPPPSAIEDFWSMVWHDNVHVILMLTNFIEREMLKADMYWVPKGRVVDVGVFTIELKDEEVSSRGYTLRTIELRQPSTNESRLVYHVQLTSWPDHGVLQDFAVIKPLLCLVHGLNARNERTRSEAIAPPSRPIVVHCSAGIGRSGTFIAIDIILQQLRALPLATATEEQVQAALNVRAIVHRIRCQRPGMVQTTDQYQMIYQYIRAVLAGQS
ncbi:hypothetical protein H310_01306 [Aphanomyces invadans]|uniref:Uncharacterized protein n=1 Tax=Aphanomyces invadans TaxID=157072 RepID=A0A024UT05_9STRA|nr:hypothetical protein H310_01306 [Aphanomyces invadans]ETW08793.1 hypothetical protein H310_01306 [Aphanomyces invadans]|eukprot:XP_008862598.1 hypothetical protein H310_01306 [Aphanomyces invadans]